MLKKLLSKLFSVETLSGALAKKPQVLKMEVMTEADLAPYHRAIQAELEAFGLNMMNMTALEHTSPKHHFLEGKEDADLH